jgi:TonB family protein
MFSQAQRALGRQSWSCMLVSLALHGAFIAVLMVAFAPKFVKTSLVREGEGGTSMTLLYWPARQGETSTADDSAPAALVRPRTAPLTWARAQRRNQARRSRGDAAVGAKETASSADRTTQARLAGSPYGSLGEGALSGSEVRPAIRLSGPNPFVSVDELPGGQPGRVVVEATIDERGNIAGLRVVESLSPPVDAKVLAAVEEWHFLPAMRDGVPIASKQDVYYRFPR